MTVTMYLSLLRCVAPIASRRTLATLPPRKQAQIEDELLEALKLLAHPVHKSQLGDIGVVERVAVDDDKVTVTIRVPTKASPSTEQLATVIRDESERYLQAGGMSSVPVHVETGSWRHASSRMAAAGKCLEQVGSVIAVASGKGGVGKSTVAVNLAFALAARGARVGILDADVYGPSLPTMVTPVMQGGADVRQGKDGTISAVIGPLGVRCMSYGWVSRRNERGERGGAFMRGPMVSQVVQQMAKFTEWGPLDHLVLDMPPGTGDIHISLGQLLPLTGAVHVTTPQALALMDVAKGVDMFSALKVPPIGMVMNMAWFEPEDVPGKRYYPFGGSEETLSAILSRARLTRDHLFEMPIQTSLSAAGDSGVPEVVARPESSASKMYDLLAARVAAYVEHRVLSDATREGQSTRGPGTAGLLAQTDKGKVQTSMGEGETRTTVLHVPGRGIVVRTMGTEGASELVLSPPAVRRACRCAACVDEMTGSARLKPDSVPDTVVPRQITLAGNYGVAVTWSDGHASSIYTFDQLATATNDVTMQYSK